MASGKKKEKDPDGIRGIDVAFMASGTTSGGVIGFLVGGPIGAAIGAALGCFVGSPSSRRKKDEKKR
jgi:uncharacterized membrane protein